MRTAAILPIKSFGAAKQRLSSLLGTGSRQALAQAMFQDVLASLRKVEGIEVVVIVASEPSVEFAADDHVVLIEDELRDGQSAAAQTGIRWAVDHGFERVLLVPGDTPLLSAAELDRLLSDPPAAVVIVPDRHGTGTNGLVLCPPDAIGPSFGPGSRARHERLARDAGAECRIAAPPSLALDVDTLEDLAVLRAALDARTGGAAHTRGLLSRLGRR